MTRMREPGAILVSEELPLAAEAFPLVAILAAASKVEVE